MWFTTVDLSARHGGSLGQSVFNDPNSTNHPHICARFIAVLPSRDIGTSSGSAVTGIIGILPIKGRACRGHGIEALSKRHARFAADFRLTQKIC